MADAWLIILSVVTALLILAATVYIFFLFCHPDDNSYGAGWVAKGVVILAMAIVWGFVMLLPLDVANSRGEGGGLNMDLAYQIILIAYFVMMVAILPFMLFLYESDEDKPISTRLCWAATYSGFLVFSIAGLAFIAWVALRKAVISDAYQTSLVHFTRSEASGTTVSQVLLHDRVAYNLPPYLFMIVFAIFLGWCLFVVFGGIGIVALPFDMILDYNYRPRPRTAIEMAEKKIALRRRCEELSSFTNALENLVEEEQEKTGMISKWRAAKLIKTKEGKLKKEIDILEQEYEIYEEESTLTANPIVNLVKLVVGCVFAIVSFFLVLHLVLYNVIVVKGKPLDFFLNTFLFWVEFKVTRFFSTIIFAFISMYLVFCVMKGNIKFGLRIFFLMPVHEMKLSRTYMNSFLFNTILIQFSTLASVHFIIMLFSNYMQLTAGLNVFGILVTKMRFLRFFWEEKVFLYIFLGMAGLTFAYLLLKPRDDRMDIKAMIARRKNA